MTLGPVLSILGLAPYFQDAETIVTVSKEAYEAIKYAKKMLDSEDGHKFKKSISDAIAAAEKSVVPHEINKAPAPTVAGHYEWDGFEGWVWRPAGEEQ